MPLRQVTEGQEIINRHGYADDTQLFTKLTWKDPETCDTEISTMEKCLFDVILYKKEIIQIIVAL